MYNATRAGRALVLSGIIGLLAFASLFGALYLRETTADQQQWAAGLIQPGVWDLLFRGHDLGVILQCLLLLPAALVLRRHGTVAGPFWRSPMAFMGVSANLLLALSLVLVFVTQASDMLYMLPQAFVGAWIIAVCRARTPGLGKLLRGFGWVVGIGLVIVGLADIGIIAALGPSVMAIIGPVPKQVDPVGVTSALNAWSHVALDIGSLLGVPTLPIWSILAGRAIARAATVPAGQAQPGDAR
jgi:hypothetical protein